MQGKIIKGIAGFYYVHVVESGVYECKAKGVFRKEKRKPLVGDNVEIEVLEELAKDHSLFVTIEENVITGGFGEQVMDYVSRAALNVHVRNIGISDEYVEHGNVEVLRKEVGLDRDAIVKQTISDYLRIMENKKKR